MQSEFTGVRKLILSGQVAGSTTRRVTTLIGDVVSTDGISSPFDSTELKQEGQATTSSVPIGVEAKQGTINLLPYSMNDMKMINPDGYDEVTDSWALFAQSCSMSDLTIAFEKACVNADGTHGINYLWRHAILSPAFNLAAAINKQLALAVPFYPQFTPGSEYGYTDAKSTLPTAVQFYKGLYDGTTDKITYDKKGA